MAKDQRTLSEWKTIFDTNKFYGFYIEIIVSGSGDGNGICNAFTGFILADTLKFAFDKIAASSSNSTYFLFDNIGSSSPSRLVSLYMTTNDGYCAMEARLTSDSSSHKFRVRYYGIK